MGIGVLTGDGFRLSLTSLGHFGYVVLPTLVDVCWIIWGFVLVLDGRIRIFESL